MTKKKWASVPLHLTDEEREAIKEACDEGRWYPKDYHHISAMRALLERATMSDEVNEMSAASRGSAVAPQGFTEELADLLNRHSMENASGTPDFILARYLTDCLLAWNRSMQEREAWHGRQANPDMSGLN